MEETIINSLIQQMKPASVKIWTRENGSTVDAFSLIIGAVKHLCPEISEAKILRGITDGFKDKGIDAIIFDKKNQQISVFDSECTNYIKHDCVQSYLKSIDDLIFGSASTNSFTAPKLLSEARKAINNSWTVRLYVVRGKCVSSQEIERATIALKRFQRRYSIISSVGVFDASKLTDLIIGEPLNKVKFAWSLISNTEDGESSHILVREGGAIKSLFVRVSMSEIVALREDYEENGFNLFEANVRGFQGKRDLSYGLLGTLSSNTKHFYKYHNGITLSCKKIETARKGRYVINDPQVINGCQTVETIHEAYRNGKITSSQLRKALVLCKIYSLNDADIEKVCEATNTQLKINNWDLRANDPIQKKIELVLNSRISGYKRKSGQGPAHLSVPLTSLGQWLYACKHGKPADAKNKKKQLFDIAGPDALYRTIYNDTLREGEVLDIYRIGRLVTKTIKERKVKKQKRFEQHANLHIMAGIYLLWKMKPKKIREKGLRDSFVLKKHKTVLAIIKKVAPKIASSGGKKVSESFNYVFTKNTETWAEISRRLTR